MKDENRNYVAYSHSTYTYCSLETILWNLVRKFKNHSTPTATCHPGKSRLLGIEAGLGCGVMCNGWSIYPKFLATWLWICSE